ncbi:uncharacterized protein LOC131955756 [Physella acuta]|uniref:uncharacterized protein LOC131955756 n=1 Tax=Physella acuta TaxID=109671 RepID=UPI0027DC768E|nr:uncharacterized protein LOC131955756 [Physella acuta]
MVDLRGLYTVEQIVITNRGDDQPSSDRAQNYQIDVFPTDPRLSPNFPMASGQVCYTRIAPLGVGETFTQNCSTPIVGRFVRFIRYTPDLMNLCEIKVMASSVSYRENKFSRTENSRLTIAPFTTTTTTSPTTCSLTCLERRDSDTCTAFNWIRTSNQCQMFSLDPRIPVSLTADSDTDFYIQA